MNYSIEDIARLYPKLMFTLPDKLTGEAGAETLVQKPLEKAGTPEISAINPEVVTEETVREPADNGKSASKEPADTPRPNPVIEWKPKPNSKVLFVLRPAEFTDRSLTDLLKKIVEAMKIPFGDAGFGILSGNPTVTDWEAMPNDHAIIFDRTTNTTGENPVKFNDKQIYFTGKLADLKGDRAGKKVLWEQLQAIMEQIG